jgi:hypothetical protein
MDFSKACCDPFRYRSILGSCRKIFDLLRLTAIRGSLLPIWCGIHQRNAVSPRVSIIYYTSIVNKT